MAIRRLDAATDHDGHDVRKHAEQVRDKVRPALGELRACVDNLETRTPRDLWPIPTYREMLTMK